MVVSYERGTPVQTRIAGGKEGAVCFYLENGNSNSYGARPVHLITSMIKWIRISSSSMTNSLSLQGHFAHEKTPNHLGSP